MIIEDYFPFFYLLRLRYRLLLLKGVFILLASAALSCLTQQCTCILLTAEYIPQ